MKHIKVFADRRPLAFALLTFLVWFLLAGALVAATAALLGVSIGDEIPQSVGMLGATGVLLVVAGRLGWLRSMGVIGFGNWRVWLLAIPMGTYLVLAYLYGFFGELSFDWGIFARSGEARGLILRQGVVGFVEETLFRGLVLYALVRVWGKSRRGLVASVIVQAALFGVIHMLQVATGSSPLIALLVVVNGFLSAIWWGVLVLQWGTLWPVMVFHALSNLAVQAQSLSDTIIQPPVAAYGRATLFELPLLAIGIWLLLRKMVYAQAVIEH